jgi:hypothetical protein
MVAGRPTEIRTTYLPKTSQRVFYTFILAQEAEMKIGEYNQ